MIVLDTTVLVYAVGSDHPLREPCRGLVAAVRSGRTRATTSVEVIQEFAHVRSRRTSRPEAVALAGDYADLLAPLLVSEADHLRRGLSLFERTPGLGPFDAVLAALAIDHEATHLVSADRGFASVVAVEHVFPDAAGVAALIG